VQGYRPQALLPAPTSPPIQTSATTVSMPPDDQADDESLIMTPPLG